MDRHAENSFATLDSRQALRTAIVMEWLTVGVAIGAIFALQSYLPRELQQYLARQPEHVGPLELMILLSLIGLLAASLVASVGLYFFKPWARTLYLVTLVLGLVAVRLTGPTVMHSLPSALESLAATLSGVVVGISYFGGVFPPASAGRAQDVRRETVELST